jgi:hypothetical protein
MVITGVGKENLHKDFLLIPYFTEFILVFRFYLHHYSVK